MPLVKIYLQAGKSAEHKKAIGDGVHKALVDIAKVPADDRFQVFVVLDASSFIADPHYGDAQRSADQVVIEITFNVGRTVELKKQLYAEIAKNLGENAKIRGDDVMILLVEVPRENWSFAHGIALYAT